MNEAKKLNLPIYGLVDTNSDPNLVDFPIPANDDSFNSISFLLDYIAKGIYKKNPYSKLTLIDPSLRRNFSKKIKIIKSYYPSPEIKKEIFLVWGQ